MTKEQNFRDLYNETLKKMTNVTDKQRAILNAALELFAAQGYEATSTSQIAERAHVSVGSVYHVFANKRELLMGVLSPLFQQSFQAAANQFVEETLGKEYDDFASFIKALITDRFNYLDANFKEMKVLFGELLTNQDFMEQIKAIYSRQLLRSVTPTIEHFKQIGAIQNLPTKEIIQFTMGPVAIHFGKLVLGIAAQNPAEKQAEIDQNCQLIVRALSR